MTNRKSAATLRRLSFVCSLGSVAVVLLACSSKDDPNTVGLPGGTGATAPAGGAASTPGVPGGATAGTGIALGGFGADPGGGACAGKPRTTITGKVYDPAGKVPLYNVLVYVPSGPVEPFAEGVTCDRCDAKVLNPIASAVTDETGGFVLTDAPAGENVPLVIQVGKWRRQITVPSVAACADTALTDPNLTRLPRNKAEGDIPRMAIAVGGADQLECLPLRMGIDPAEFTTATGDGRIHLFLGSYDERGDTFQPATTFDAMHGGGALTPATDLWASQESLMKYDITLLSCEGGDYARDKPMASRQAMYDYASAGGRVFASHWHAIWFGQGPDPVPTTGTWMRRRINPAGNQMNANGDGTPIPATVNETFPKGQALAKWLVNTGASVTQGTMDVQYPRDDIQEVNPELAREWITVQNPNYPEAPKAVQYMSFNAPIGAPENEICGRAVFTDLHVASVDDSTTANLLGFPASCEQRDLSAQEKAVAFMLFDLSACVQNEDKPPKPPE
ncbi:MAG: hypothetical protein K0R38_7017 [Polyangiaceae bacterium]|jgi:hypothetical protein|nr:hypothetical protein [Polyangiaceae bacterium]